MLIKTVLEKLAITVLAIFIMIVQQVTVLIHHDMNDVSILCWRFSIRKAF